MKELVCYDGFKVKVNAFVLPNKIKIIQYGFRFQVKKTWVKLNHKSKRLAVDGSLKF